MSVIEITFRPHWVNGSWLRAFTDPYVDVDGSITRCSWRAPTTIAAEPGPRTVHAFVRYRHIPLEVGHGTNVIPVPSTGTVRVVAANWLTNHSPFIPRATGRD